MQRIRARGPAGVTAISGFLVAALGGARRDRASLEQRTPRSLNSKVRLISHRAYGFHSADALIAMIYLCCAGITIALPHR